MEVLVLLGLFIDVFMIYSLANDVRSHHYMAGLFVGP